MHNIEFKCYMRVRWKVGLENEDIMRGERDVDYNGILESRKQEMKRMVEGHRHRGIESEEV